jgi:hypothetical protein
MKLSESLPFFRTTVRHLVLSNPAHDHDSGAVTALCVSRADDLCGTCGTK